MEYKNEQEKYEAEEIKEKWEKLTIPLILLMMFLFMWVLFAKVVIADTEILNGYVKTQGERTPSGIRYEVDGKMYIKYLHNSADDIPVGTIVPMYYKEENPFKIRYKEERENHFMLAVPLALFTLGDLYWLYRILKPKEKHYLGEERPDAEKS